MLGSTPAIQWYKVRLCHIDTQEIAVVCGGYIRYQVGDILLDSRLLHPSWMDFDSVCGALLGSTPAMQRYNLRLCRIRTQEFAVFYEGRIRYQAGDTLLDGGLLHNHSTDVGSICGGLLGSTPATQRYKVHLCRIKAQEIAVFGGGCINYQAGDILNRWRIIPQPLYRFWLSLREVVGPDASFPTV